MKITLDIDELREKGEISAAEYQRLAELGHRSGNTLAFNLLVGFGVIAVAAGIAALTKSASAAGIIGLLLLLAGIFIKQKNGKEWLVLANMLLITGALLFGGAVFATGRARTETFALVAAVYAVVAWLAGSGLLAALATLVLGGLVGAGTAYGHAMYAFWTKKPLLTILVFTAFAGLVWWLAQQMKSEKRRLLEIAARTAVFMVMLGFWIGSLWGDRTFATFNSHSYQYEGLILSRGLFSIAWALALAAAIWWGWKNNRRWLVNTAAVFAGIHFYTQMFEYFRFNPTSLLAGGLLALAFALGLVRLNRTMEEHVA